MGNPRGRWASVALAGTIALVGAGCGSSGGSSSNDVKAIKAVLLKAVTTKDVNVKCVDVVTTQFVSTVYGSLATCKTAEAKSDANPTTGATVTNVKVDGSSATATVTTHGGNNDGTTGTIDLVKKSGDWKVNALEVSYLRSGVEHALRSQKTGPLADQNVTNCIVDKLKAIPDPAFTSMAYDAISNRDNQQFLQIVSGCISDASSNTTTTSSAGSGKVSFLRQKFEEGIAQSAKKDGRSQAEIDCIVKELRKSITDQDIIDQIGKSQKQLDPKVTKATAVAMIDCSK